MPSSLMNYCFVFIQIFEDEKVHHLLTFGEYPLYVMPLDEDVLSFELDLAYKVCLKIYFTLAILSLN